MFQQVNLKNSQGSTILNELLIDYHEKTVGKFPWKFSINLTNVKTNELNIISFIRIHKNHFAHPIASSRIFSWNENKDDDIKLQENSTSEADVNILLNLHKIINP